MRHKLICVSGFVLTLAFTAALVGCGSDDDGGASCVGAACGAAGSAQDAATQDVAVSDAAQSDSVVANEAACAPLADVTDLIDDAKLFFGYSVLGTSSVQPGCGDLGQAREVAVSLTPSFTGNLVLSTQHPSTRVDTVLEVREASCDGTAIGCSGTSAAGVHGSRLSVPVVSGKQYVAIVETADDDGGIFALGLHRPGVCDGEGVSADVTDKLLTGVRFEADTSASSSSVRGSCAKAADDAPEARWSFAAPRDGAMVATTSHPKTGYTSLLHVRETGVSGASYCDSPEAECGCGAGAAFLRFDVFAGRVYDLFVDGDGASAKGAATVTLGYAATSPATAALQGCSHASIQDQFGFLVQSGQSVVVKVDTVDAATAADLRLRIRHPDGTELFEADDEVSCTYPPPKYSCPEHSFTATATGLHTLEVYVGTSEACADHGLVGYKLTATVDGQASELVHFKDQ